LDLFLFLFVIQFIFCMNHSTIGFAIESFMGSLKETFLFITLLVFNLGGLLPYSYSFFRIIEFTLVFSLVAWMTSFLTFISSERFFLYLYKKGDNVFKSFFFIVIELISEFCRPVALTVRLTANVIIGHLVIKSLYYLMTFICPWFFFGYVFIIIVECFVLIIQSYIFARLVQFYLNE
uniref:F-ATPase protein 6 n=1 Tax=Strongyloides venezuelensis TaxID=75913 RepID=A0A0K0FLV9_STRVS